MVGTANVLKLAPTEGSKRSSALSSPTAAICSRSSSGTRPPRSNRRAIELASGRYRRVRGSRALGSRLSAYARRSSASRSRSLVGDIKRRRERKRLGEPAEMDRPVDRRPRRTELKLEFLALRALMERDEQMQP